MSQCIRFLTMCDQQGLRSDAHVSSLIRAFASRLSILLTEHHLEFLSLKGGCRGSSGLTLVKMSKMSYSGSNNVKNQLMKHMFTLPAICQISLLVLTYYQIYLQWLIYGLWPLSRRDLSKIGKFEFVADKNNIFFRIKTETGGFAYVECANQRNSVPNLKKNLKLGK